MYQTHTYFCFLFCTMALSKILKIITVDSVYCKWTNPTPVYWPYYLLFKVLNVFYLFSTEKGKTRKRKAQDHLNDIEVTLTPPPPLK